MICCEHNRSSYARQHSHESYWLKYMHTWLSEKNSYVVGKQGRDKRAPRKDLTVLQGERSRCMLHLLHCTASLIPAAYIGQRELKGQHLNALPTRLIKLENIPNTFAMCIQTHSRRRSKRVWVHFWVSIRLCQMTQ